MSLKETEWLTEIYNDGTAFSAKYARKLFDEQSPFQCVQIYETQDLGGVLILDGCYMVTEKDAFVYHEMLVHPAMEILPEARRALVVGGGDGGAVGQLVKYPQLESVVLCEIDAMVVDSCRKYLPSVAVGLDDPRVDVRIEDGVKYVRNNPAAFDVIFVDSTDPVGPAEALFEKPFFESVKAGLRPGGVAVFQTESPMFMLDTFVSAVNKLAQVFGKEHAFPYFATIPCYPGGLWSFTLCSEKRHPLTDAPESMDPELLKELEYYNADIHKAAFAAPGFVRKALAQG